jgi:hypothetical protein
MNHPVSAACGAEVAACAPGHVVQREMNTMRVRFWVESAMASLTAGLAIVTVFWHEWIEILFNVDPDGGDGSLEWLIVLGLAVTTIILAWRARMDWRRARAVS